MQRLILTVYSLNQNFSLRRRSTKQRVAFGTLQTRN